MAKDTGRKWRNRRIICVQASKRAAANIAVAAFGWGPDFFSIPLKNKTSHVVQEYAADCVLTDEMVSKLQTLQPSILQPNAIEIPGTTQKGSARLLEVAARRNLDLK